MEKIYVKRIFSYLVDSVICVNASLFISLAYAFIGVVRTGAMPGSVDFFLILNFGFYYLCMICKDIWKGGSIGKKIFKLSVVSVDNCEKRANIIQRIIRNVGEPIIFIDCIVLFLTKRRIGDFIARTIVAEKAMLTKQ